MTKRGRPPAPRSDAAGATIHIPLAENFVFQHEAVGRREHAPQIVGSTPQELRSQFIGRRLEIDELLLRLSRSRGGSFLITGYRGVGKTSFVNQVIHELRRDLKRRAANAAQKAEVALVDVHLSLARAVNPMGLMYHVIHGLHQRLDETGLLERLPAPLREALALAWQRTSLQIARTQSEGRESGLSLDGSSLLGLTLGLSARRNRSQQLELQYLAYDEHAAERDLIRIAQGLCVPFRRRRSRGERLRFWRRPEPLTQLKIVLVFDELDKLQVAADAHGSTPVDELISALKNLLTTSGICFIFVAGKDLEDRLALDVEAGDSIYESVFTYNRYLTVLWDDARALVEEHVLKASAGSAAVEGGAVAAAPNGWRLPHGLDHTIVYEDFQDFVAFHGRGIPRRALRLFHSFVRWNGARCIVEFHQRDYRRMRFFADLERLLRAKRDELLRSRDDYSLVAARDHARLGLYYLVDWILQQGDGSFTATEAIAATRRMSRKIAFVDRLAGPAVRALIALLERERYLSKAKDETGAIHAEVSGVPESRYQLAPERLVQLGGGDVVLRDDASLFPTPPHAALPRIANYEFERVIGSGGFGKVYMAVDSRSNREVAVKILRSDLALLPEARARFRRSVELFERLRGAEHPNIARVFELGETPGGELFHVTEFVAPSLTLRDALRSGPLDLATALGVARLAAAGYAFLHARGLIRLDVKSHNILVTPAGRVAVFDYLDIAEAASLAESIQTDGSIVGSPGYFAPEQILGKTLDARCDVYALGIVLFECLVGRLPYPSGASDLQRTATQAIGGSVPRLRDHVEVPDEVDELVAKAMAPFAAERFQSMQELLDAINRAGGDAAVLDLHRFTRKSQTIFAGESGSTDESTRFASEDASSSAKRTSSSEASVDTGTRYEATSSRAEVAAAVVPQPLAVDAPSAAESSGYLRVVQLSQDQSVVDEFDAPLLDRTVIGRSAECDVTLRSESVSRRHALIESGSTITATGPTWLVRDLGTANGTIVNGAVVRGATYLKTGDCIEIGEFAITVTLPGAPLPRAAIAREVAPTVS
ncbi:MAG: protein kinase domain-containing protein [Planctomycetota bacterium]